MSLETDYPFLAIMHPAHLAYVRNLPINTMNYFLHTLDKLKAAKRQEIMYGTFFAMVESLEEVQGVEPKTDKTRVTYEIFRDRWRESNHLRHTKQLPDELPPIRSYHLLGTLLHPSRHSH